MQFHPEKSSAAGLRMLANFSRICVGAAAAVPGVSLYPAVDILDGKAVRLTRGHFDERTIYGEDPLAAAAAFRDAGASYLHVVDLDGARSGEPANLEHLRRIAAERDCRSSTAAGCALRSRSSARSVRVRRRVILGTAAFADPQLLREAIAQHGPERVLVSVDVRGGLVATDGWERTRSEDAVAAAQVLLQSGGHPARLHRRRS